MIPIPYIQSNYNNYNITLGGEMLGDSRFAYFKFTITSTSTTNVGIKVPIIRNINCNLENSTSARLSLDRFNIVGNSPAIGSGLGRPTGYNRIHWVVSSDADYYYIYTSNSTQKSALTVGEAYWFGIEITGYGCEKNDTISIIDASPINFIRASYYTVYNIQGITTVLDYNA